jgi:hypothetical protein
MPTLFNLHILPNYTLSNMPHPCPLDPRHPLSCTNLIHSNSVPRIVRFRSRLRFQRHNRAIDALNVWPGLCPRVGDSMGYFLDA